MASARSMRAQEMPPPLGAGGMVVRGMTGSKLSSKKGTPQRNGGGRSSGGGPERPRSALRRTPAPQEVPPQESDLEKEYIYNLQQQVYFLELELKMHKEQEVTHVQGTPLPNDVLQQAAPLEQHMKQLKLKYVELQKEHDEEVKTLKDEKEELHDNLTKEKFNCIRLETEVAELRSQINSMKDDHEAALADWQDVKVALQKQIDHLNNELTDRKADFERLLTERDQLMSDFSQTKLDLSQTTFKLKESEEKQALATKRYQALQESTEDVRARIVELEEERQSYDSRINIEKEANKKLSDERWQAGLEVKSIELKLEQATHALSKAQDDCQTLAVDNSNLQAKVGDLMRENAALKHGVAERDRNRDDNKEQRIKLTNKLADEREKIDDLEKTLGERDARIAKLEGELERAQHKIEGHDANVNALRDEIQHLKDRFSKQDVENAGLRHDKAMLQADVEDLQRELEKTDGKTEELAKDKAGLQAEVEKLKVLARIAESINALKVGEFQQMMASNFQVANNLHCLLEDFDRLQGISNNMENNSS